MIIPRGHLARAFSSDTESPALIVVAGPTGSGKTALAIELARRLDTEILSADSMQCYRGMEIGTAAPTREEQAVAVHHFVSFLSPDAVMAAGEYERLARIEAERLNGLGKTVVVAGGSGLYISALVDGLFEGPPSNPGIRRRLKEEAETLGNAALMARLRTVDPDYSASMTSENDLVRIIRALEVHETTGIPLSVMHREHRARTRPLPAIQVGLDWDRALLYERLNWRVDAMLREGWLAEVEGLIEGGYGPDLERLKALGYREMAAYLRGEQSLEAAAEAAKQHHRRYAKRQLTWFRADERVQWLAATPDTSAESLANQILDRWPVLRRGVQ